MIHCGDLNDRTCFTSWWKFKPWNGRQGLGDSTAHDFISFDRAPHMIALHSNRHPSLPSSRASYFSWSRSTIFPMASCLRWFINSGRWSSESGQMLKNEWVSCLPMTRSGIGSPRLFICLSPCNMAVAVIALNRFPYSKAQEIHSHKIKSRQYLSGGLLSSTQIFTKN